MSEAPTLRKVHRIVLCVVDGDDIGAAEAASILENARYPNHCMYPQVIETETREVQWTDDHPLNATSTAKAAFAKLFHR